MPYVSPIAGTRYVFDDLRTLLARASPARAGDRLAVSPRRAMRRRVAARMVLADVPLKQFLSEALIPYEEDDVTRLIIDSHDASAFATISTLTLGALRDWLLSDEATTEALKALAPGITPEMAAAVSKLHAQSGSDSRRAENLQCHEVSHDNRLAWRLSVRLQPNHPSDDVAGIGAAILDGLMYGCGDACIGINPATDSAARALLLLERIDELRERFDIPIQSCVLAHVTTTLQVMEKRGPVDLVFQSIAGSQAAK